MELRFVFPLIPLIMFWILKGMHCFHFPRMVWCIRILFILLIGIGFALEIFRAARLHIKGNPLKCSAYTSQSMHFFKYIRDNTTKNSIILFFKPRVMTLQTDRRSLYILKQEHLDKGDYYCYTDDPQDKSGSLLNCKRLKECYREGPFRLYRIVRKTSGTNVQRK